MIDDFVVDASRSFIALPSSLSVAERTALHQYAGELGSHHRSATREGGRQLIIMRWLPFVPVTVAIGRTAVGSTVMRIAPPATEREQEQEQEQSERRRGIIADFDAAHASGPSWMCRYQRRPFPRFALLERDGNGTKETWR